MVSVRLCVLAGSTCPQMSVQTIKFLSMFGTSLLCLLLRPLVKCFLRQQMLKVSSIPVWTMCQMNAKLLIVFVTKRASLIESRLVHVLV